LGETVVVEGGMDVLTVGTWLFTDPVTLTRDVVAVELAMRVEVELACTVLLVVDVAEGNSADRVPVSVLEVVDSVWLD
jgi:hypothetical protein